MQPIIVEAVGVAINPLAPQAAELQGAMAAAVHAALADGIDINDSDAIRARLTAAREAVLAQR